MASPTRTLDLEELTTLTRALLAVSNRRTLLGNSKVTFSARTSPEARSRPTALFFSSLYFFETVAAWAQSGPSRRVNRRTRGNGRRRTRFVGEGRKGSRGMGGFLLEIDALLGVHSTVVRMLDEDHFRDQIGLGDQIGDGAPSGEDQVEIGRLLVDEGQEIVERQEAQGDGDVDLVQDHHFVVAGLRLLAGESEALAGRLPVLLGRELIVEDLVEAAPGGEDLQMRRQPFRRVELAGVPGSFHELDHDHPEIVADGPERQAEGRGRLPFA